MAPRANQVPRLDINSGQIQVSDLRVLCARDRRTTSDSDFAMKPQAPMICSPGRRRSRRDLWGVVAFPGREMTSCSSATHALDCRLSQPQFTQRQFLLNCSSPAPLLLERSQRPSFHLSHCLLELFLNSKNHERKRQGRRGGAPTGAGIVGELSQGTWVRKRSQALANLFHSP